MRTQATTASLKVDADKFRNSPIGHLTAIGTPDASTGVRYSAFVPAALPREVPLAQATYKKLSVADRALGALEAKIHQVPNPRLVVQPSIAREAVSTSALEGTYAPLADVLEAEYVEDRKQTAEVREVQNYVRAALNGVDLVGKKPICVTMLQDLQKMIVRGTRGDGYDAGMLRQHQVCIGNAGEGIEQARFVPPPPGDLLVSGMSDWEKWVNARDEIPLLVKAALGHYQFETLHPFSDGNGRLGRLVITLQLIDGGALTHPILNLSPWFEPRRDAYLDHLLNTTITGDFDPWVSFFADAVAARADAASNTITEMLNVRSEMIKLLKDDRAKGAILDLASDLIGYPRISVRQTARLYQITYPAANSIVSRLVELGILREITGSSYGRIFACDRVYNVIAKA
jgi:Fic family protein